MPKLYIYIYIVRKRGGGGGAEGVGGMCGHAVVSVDKVQQGTEHTFVELLC